MYNNHKNAIKYAMNYLLKSPIAPHVNDLLLYGSCVKGKEKPESDVDLFLELNESISQVPNHKKLLLIMRSEFGSGGADLAEIDLKLMVGDEWRTSNITYYQNVRKEGISLWQ